MPNDRTSQAPPFTFTTDELSDVRSLERVFRRIQTAFNSIDFPVPPPLNLDALAAKLRPLLEAPGAFPLNLTALIPSSSSTGGIAIEDTHNVRLTVYTPPTISIGSLYYETDRAVLYTVYNNSGTLVWKYVAGTMYNTLANIPVDLGTNDTGFQFVNSDADQNTLYIWTGTEFVTVDYLQSILDATTNTTVTVQILRHLTTGTAAAGFGMRQIWQLENGAGTTTSMGLIDHEIVTATAGSEDSLWRWWNIVAGALTNLMTLAQTGNLTLLVGDYVWRSGTANNGTLTHANTGNRAYTFADADGNIVYQTAALTSGNLVRGGGGALVVDTGVVAPTFAPVTSNVDLTGQTATVGPTTIASTGDHFLFSYSLFITTTDVGAATVTVSIAYTDDIGATTQAGAALAVTATNRQTGVFVVRRASGNIDYTVTVTGAIGTAVYAFHSTLQRFS